MDCLPEYEGVFYIDDHNLAICMFSNITGKQSVLFTFKDYLGKTKSAVFTDLQMRQNRNIIKFLLSWADPRASSSDKKYLFTWISYDIATAKIIADQSNCDGPRYGVYATFLVGVPSGLELKDGTVSSHYTNLNECIVCLDQDMAT